VDNKATSPGFQTGMPASEEQRLAVSDHLSIQPVHWINQAWFSWKVLFEATGTKNYTQKINES